MENINQVKGRAYKLVEEITKEAVELNYIYRTDKELRDEMVRHVRVLSRALEEVEALTKRYKLDNYYKILIENELNTVKNKPAYNNVEEPITIEDLIKVIDNNIEY